MARLRPSSADRWVVCPGSVQMQERFPELTDSENDAAREGTAAHHALECLLTNKPIEAGNIAPNGVVITEEMIEGAEMVVLDVISIAGTNPVQVEKHVKIPRVHGSECEGTPDVSYYNNELYVWDLKFGYGVIEAVENYQLICYAIGKLDEITGGDGLKDQHIRVNMRIVQPRIYHPDGIVRTWSIMGSDLRGYANRLNEAANKALGVNPPAMSGNHCKHCTARANCQSAHRASMNAIDMVANMVAETIPANYLATHRAALIRALGAIEHRLTGVEAQIMATIKNGKPVQGLGLDNPPGRLKWSKSDEEILALGDLMGVNLGKRSLVTPTQANKLIDESVIKAYSTRPLGKTKIVNSTTTRASVVFGKK